MDKLHNVVASAQHFFEKHQVATAVAGCLATGILVGRHYFLGAGGTCHKPPPSDRVLDVGINYCRPDVTVTGVKAKEAKEWFERGMSWLFAFYQEEACRCFHKAIELSDAFPAAHWGLAYAHNPDYNIYGTQSRLLGHTFAALGLKGARPNARTLVQHASIAKMQAAQMDLHPWEKAAIDSVCIRFPGTWLPHLLHSGAALVEFMVYGNQLDRSSTHRRYCDALKRAHGAMPEDPDVAFLYCDALMMLKPWRLYAKDGTPVAEAVEARRVLQAGLALHPTHAGLAHMMIHLCEMSPTPGDALEASDLFCSYTETDDRGHLPHMSSHIYVQLGKYREGVDCNQKGIIADDRCILPSDFGYVIYSAHNRHFKLYCAMLGGMEREAMQAVEQMEALLPAEVLWRSPLHWLLLEPYYPMRTHALVRFGKWKAILAQQLPSNALVYNATTAIMRYGRCLALAALNRIEEAEKEEKLLHAIANSFALRKKNLHNIPMPMLLKPKLGMVRGEILYRQGRYEEAFKELREAVRLEEELPYDEPWAVMQPCRHALGALLLEQGRVNEAAEEYRKDLAEDKHPRNPWALQGLIQCLETETGSTTEVATLRQQLATQRAEAGADAIEITVSCCCATKLKKQPKLN